ncbi:MAG: aspartate kinase, partial [Lachnospiraceae bacterium]|nr:aspartate kinase [Lachnospiraceae bacterium]
DVSGVYSTDPRSVENVVKLETITYDEMLELASAGAKVLHNRCVEIGKNYDVPISVKSTFEENSIGTCVGTKLNMEKLTIIGIAEDKEVSKITIIGKENKIGRICKVFNLLADSNINIDMMVQSAGEHWTKDLSFLLKTTESKNALDILNKNLDELDIGEIKVCDKLSKISVVGVGLVNNTKVASKIFEVLYKNNISMNMISASEIKISILVNKKEADKAIKALHKEFFNV